MTGRAPTLDGRDVSVVLAELLARRPGYLPAWRPEAGEPAYALLQAVALLAGLTVDRLDQVPERDLLAFLGAAGIELLPPHAASTPVVFRLAADAPVDVALPEGTELAVSLPPPLPSSLGGHQAEPVGTGDPLVFTTDVATSLARARLVAAVSVVPAQDRTAVHDLDSADGLRWFGDLSLVKHELYLGHDTLFELPPSAEVALQVGQTRATGLTQPTDPARIRWEYLTTDGWLAFEPVVDQSKNLTLDGEVLLRKVVGAPSVQATIDGTRSYWLRGVTRDPLPAAGVDPQSGPLPRLDTIRVRLTNRTDDLPVDAVVANGLPSDPTTELLPFGPQPDLGATMAIACDDAFKRTAARITVTLRLSVGSKATPSSDLQLVYEYSTGPGTWAPLPGVGGDLLGGAGERRRRISFIAPKDWAETDLSGDSHRWLRIRIAAGNYGAPPTFRTAQNVDGSWQTTQTGGAQPPLIASVTAGYAFSTPAVEPDHCRTRNQFAWADHQEAIRWGSQPFPPFQPLADPAPAAYLGFDRPLPVGLVSLFADVDEAAGREVPPDTALLWEYRSPSGWSDLSVRDGTAGFQHSGALQFIGPPDHVADAGPDRPDEPQRPVYWLRGRIRSTIASPDPRPIRGLYLNAVAATARRAVRNEPLGLSDGAAGFSLTAQRPPVLPQERVEVQEWRGETREWVNPFAGLPDWQKRFDLDPRGEVRAVWVTWQQRQHLLSSGPLDRHYTIDRLTGTVRFGDSVNGSVPARGTAVRISYDHGGGTEGNVPAGTIDQLHSAVPYVEAVTNPLPVNGGAPAESPARVRARGPQRLQHRGRAITLSDYEAMALEASTEVAVARCLPTTAPPGADPAGPGDAGRVAVVIAPTSAASQPRPSRDLIELVRAHLAAAAPAAVAAGIRVIGATYTPVSVLVNATVTAHGGAAETEHAVRAALDGFLHPLTGGQDAAGWGFGEPVFASRIARIVESVPGVDHASALQLRVGGAVQGDTVSIPAGNLPAPGRHVIRLVLGV
jgi:predicted phage baseplate assembly protein